MIHKYFLIFDFDGTIADTIDHNVAIFNRFAGEYKLRKIEPDDLEILRAKPSQEALRYLHISLIKLPRIALRMRLELYKEITSVKPLKGLKEVLWQLKEAGLTMGILTSNSSENVMKFLNRHELELFDFINSSSGIWSKGRRLSSILKKQGLSTDRVLYVGDETRDIEAAQNAGIKIVSVTWGYNSRKALAAYNPDYLISRPEELLQICGSL